MDFKELLSDEAKIQMTLRNEAKVKVDAILEFRYGDLLTQSELDELTGDSHFWEELMPYFDNAALVGHAERYLAQVSTKLSSFATASTYEEALLHRVLPEMIRRLATY